MSEPPSVRGKGIKSFLSCTLLSAAVHSSLLIAPLHVPQARPAAPPTSVHSDGSDYVISFAPPVVRVAGEKLPDVRRYPGSEVEEFPDTWLHPSRAYLWDAGVRFTISCYIDAQGRWR